MSINLYTFIASQKVASINLNNNFNALKNGINIIAQLIPSIPQQITGLPIKATYLNGNFTILANALNSLIPNIVTGLFTFVDNTMVTSAQLNGNFNIILNALNYIYSEGIPLIQYNGTGYNNGINYLSARTYANSDLILGEFQDNSLYINLVNLIHGNGQGIYYAVDFGFEFNVPTTVTSYKVQNSGSSQNTPTNWTFSASNDGITWTTLQTFVNTNFTSNDIQTINITNVNSYKYYALLNVYNDNYPANKVLNGMQFYYN